MHTSDFNFHAMAIRHLVAIYSVILLTQGGYFCWVLRGWWKLDKSGRG